MVLPPYVQYTFAAQAETLVFDPRWANSSESAASSTMAYIDVIDPAGELVNAGMGLKFPRRSASEILAKLEKFGVGLLVKEDGSVIDDDDVVDSPCVYRLIPVQKSWSSNYRDSRFPSDMEEVMRSVEQALKRHTQLIETLVRSGVKIQHNSANSDNGHCDSASPGDQHRSTERPATSPAAATSE